MSELDDRRASTAGDYGPSPFNPFTPLSSLEPFDEPLSLAEWYRSPDGPCLQVRQYTGNFDEGQRLTSLTAVGGNDFDPVLCETALRRAGWTITRPWTRGNRGGLDTAVIRL